MKSYSAEVRAEARRLHKAGDLSSREIAERLGIGSTTVRRWVSPRLHEQGIRYRARRNAESLRPIKARTCNCERPMPVTETVQHIGPLTTCLKCSREVP